MGRIVYFSFPVQGHINPTLSVIQELVHQQQQVVYYSTETFRDVIRQTGAQFRPYPAGFPMPEHGPGPFAHVSGTLESLLQQSRAVLDHHLEEVRLWRPTHIMSDSFAPWGNMVAQLLRLPSIGSVPSILINAGVDSRYGNTRCPQPPDPHLTPQWHSSFRERLHTSLRPYRFPDPPSPAQLLQTYGSLNLVYTSRGFQPLADAFEENRFRFVGPCFSCRPEAPAFPFEQLDRRPLVLVSLGTVYGNQPAFFRRCLEELADPSWQVVMSAGRSFADADLPPIPENFIVRDFVPQVDILRRCAAFVTHGGMNSVQEALYYEVPMLMTPQAADQFWISARASELGAALLLDPQNIETGAIHRGVKRILADPRYRAAAAAIGASLRTAGGPKRAAAEILSFVRRMEPHQTAAACHS